MMDPEEGGALAAARAPLVQESDPSRSERKALLRTTADETRAPATNAGGILDPLPARRRRRSPADLFPVDADGCTVSGAPILIISPLLETYLGLSTA